MIDRGTAEAGAALLAAAIAETFEDHANEAVRFNAATDPAAVAMRLQTAAEDISVLASALRILTRFAE